MKGLWIGRILGLAFASLLLLGCTDDKKKADNHVLEADGFFDRGDLDSAEIEYLNAMRLDGDNRHVIERLATIYYETGNISKAAPMLAHAVGLKTEDSGLRIKLGTILLANDDWEAASDEALAVLDKEPGHSEALVLLARTARTTQGMKTAGRKLDELAPSLENNAAYHRARGMLEVARGNREAARTAFSKARELAPDSAEVHLDLASLEWGDAKVEEAGQAFEEAASLDAAHAMPRFRLAEYRIRTGAVEAGKELLLALTREDQNFMPAWLLLADLAFSQRNFDEATDAVDQILHIDQHNIAGQFLRGRLKLAQGETEAGIKDLEELAKHTPNAVNVYHTLAMAYLGEGQVGRAELNLAKVASLVPDSIQAQLDLAALKVGHGEPAPAIESLEKLIAAHPEVIKAHYILAQAYRTDGQLERALATYQYIEEKQPEAVPPIFLRAHIEAQRGNRMEARAAYEEVLERQPDMPAAINGLVDVYLSEKDAEGALKVIDPAIARQPKRPQLQLLKAKVHLLQRDLEKAEAALLTAQALNPGIQATYLLLAQIRKATGKSAEALALLEENLKNNPDDLSTLLQIATLQSSLGNHEESARYYREVLRVSPDLLFVLNDLAALLEEHLGKLDEAHELAQKARSLAPENPLVADTLGWIVFRRGDTQHALQLIEEAAKQLGDQAIVQYHLACVHYAMANGEKAREAFERSLQINPKFRLAADVNQRLMVLAVDPAEDPDRAEEILKPVLDQRPDDMMALLKSAACRELAADHAAAGRIYEQAVKRNPKAIAPLLGLLRTRAQAGNSQEAMALAEEAWQVGRNTAGVALQLGRVALEAGAFQRAVVFLEEAAHQDPGSAEVQFHRGRALFALGRTEKSREAFAKALDQSPLPPLKRRIEDYAELVRWEQGDEALPEGARERAEQALEENAGNLAALMVLARCARDRSETQAALETYQGILARYERFLPAIRSLLGLYPDPFNNRERAHKLAVEARGIYREDTEIAVALGKIEYDRGEYREALNLLSAHRSEIEEDADALYALGLSAHQVKDRRRMAPALRRALELSPDHPAGTEARNALQPQLIPNP